MFRIKNFTQIILIANTLKKHQTIIDAYKKFQKCKVTTSELENYNLVIIIYMAALAKEEINIIIFNLTMKVIQHLHSHILVKKIKNEPNVYNIFENR